MRMNFPGGIPESWDVEELGLGSAATRTLQVWKEGFKVLGRRRRRMKGRPLLLVVHRRGRGKRKRGRLGGGKALVSAAAPAKPTARLQGSSRG